MDDWTNKWSDLLLLLMDFIFIQDNTLLVTGSADKNIRIWGLDFGDCHRSIFAHDDSIMAVQVRERERDRKRVVLW